MNLFIEKMFFIIVISIIALLYFESLNVIFKEDKEKQERGELLLFYKLHYIYFTWSY